MARRRAWLLAALLAAAAGVCPGLQYHHAPPGGPAASAAAPTAWGRGGAATGAPGGALPAAAAAYGATPGAGMPGAPGSTPAQGDVAGERSERRGADDASEDGHDAAEGSGGDSEDGDQSSWERNSPRLYANVSLAEVLDNIRASSSGSGDGYGARAVHSRPARPACRARRAASARRARTQRRPPPARRPASSPRGPPCHPRRVRLARLIVRAADGCCGNAAQGWGAQRVGTAVFRRGAASRCARWGGAGRSLGGR